MLGLVWSLVLLPVKFNWLLQFIDRQFLTCKHSDVNKSYANNIECKKYDGKDFNCI